VTEGHDDATGGPWPEIGRTNNISDTEILADMVNRLGLSDPKPLTEDSLYKAFVKAKKAADEWVKYYMISVALLVLAVLPATKEMEIIGIKITGPFVGPALSFHFRFACWSTQIMSQR
jgi:hypothetical protein